MVDIAILNISAQGANESVVGITPVSADGDYIVGNTGWEFIDYYNATLSPITITIHFGVGATVDGQRPPDQVTTIPAGVSYQFGPFPKNLYNDANGRVKFTSSATTGVRVTGYRFVKPPFFDVGKL